MANENPGIYEPGRDLTGRAKSAVVGKRFVQIAGDRVRGNISVEPATAAGRTCGVSKHDAAADELVGVARGNSRVTCVTAGGAIDAGAEVEVGADGRAVAKSSGVAVGYAITGATADADAEISLY